MAKSQGKDSLTRSGPLHFIAHDCIYTLFVHTWANGVLCPGGDKSDASVSGRARIRTNRHFFVHDRIFTFSMHKSTNRVSIVIWALLCLFSSSQAVAQAEWRLLGPAVSWHNDKSGALIKTPAHVGREMSCQSSIDVYGSPVEECRQSIVPARSGWSQFNPAVGLERITRSRTTSIRDFGQIVRDSYGEWGLMAGRGFTWQLINSESVSVEAGLAGGLWYRTTAIRSSQIEYGWKTRADRTGYLSIKSEPYKVTQTHLERRIVPFLLPVATINHRPSGMAVNVSVLPKTSINGRLVVPTSTLMIQSTFPIPL